MNTSNESFQNLINQYGQVNHDGEKLALTQDAYLADGGKQYKAIAVSESQHDGDHNADFDEHYVVSWDVLEGMENDPDHSNHCDWENPSSIELA